MRLKRSGRALRIERPWVRKAGYAYVIWAAVWFGMTGFLTSLGGHRDLEFTAWMALPGIMMMYVAVTRFFNRTVIDITPANITLHHAPLPWPGRRHVSTRDVDAVRVRVKRVYYRGGPFNECWISLERKNGKISMLVKGLEMPVRQMYAIADAMRDHLGVPVYED